MGSASLHAALSSLGQTKETHSTDNTVLETCDMAVAEWHNTFEAGKICFRHERNFHINRQISINAAE